MIIYIFFSGKLIFVSETYHYFKGRDLKDDNFLIQTLKGLYAIAFAGAAPYKNKKEKRQ